MSELRDGLTKIKNRLKRAFTEEEFVFMCNAIDQIKDLEGFLDRSLTRVDDKI